MPGSENYFKKYNRDNRVQNTDASFKDGMAFTKAPLASGKSRLLVNLDIKSDGSALSTRRGFATDEVALAFNYTTLRPKLTDPTIKICKDITQEDNINYRLVVASDYKSTDKHIENTDLYEAQTELWVINRDDEDNIPCLDEYDIKCRDMYALNMSKATADIEERSSYYYVPKVNNVNGYTLADPKSLARPIGCFAWDGNYYNFNNNGQLVRSRYSPDTLETTKTFYTETLKPKEITAGTALKTGFNMLQKEPYKFYDKVLSGELQFTGALVYDRETSEIVTEPIINTSYKIRFYYSVQLNKKYKFVYSYRENGSTTFTTITTKEVTFDSQTLPELSIDFTSPVENAIVQIEAFLYSGSSYATDSETSVDIGITYSQSATKSTTNRDLPNYDLSRVSGMLYWKNYMWLYGLPEAQNVLFSSVINEPTYFPYPNRSDVFEEPIKLCIPFNETMLVFTTTQLIQLTLNDSGWTKKVIQSNLNFTDFDVTLVQIVKNMVFFKSGDYYYMVVPKTLSLQNELAIAPVSKNIEEFLDEFTDNVPALLETLYDYDTSRPIELVHHFNFLNYEDVNNIYTFRTYTDAAVPQPSNLYINIDLMYNTVDRTWRIYTFESEDQFNIIRQDATKVGTYYTSLKATFIENGATITTTGVQFLETAKLDSSDFYIPNGSVFNKINTWQKDNGVIETTFNNMHLYKNWVLIDTGYRDNSTDYNKRFRELQLKFNNTGGGNVKFITEFVLDGETRIDKYTYTTEHIVDPSSPNYGRIYIARTPVENLELPGTTALGINTTDINAWSLDNSRFPEIAFWKARLKVSGKGYTPRFRLMSRSEERYEILGYTWVYRMMYSR